MYLKQLMHFDALIFFEGCYGVSDTASVSSTISSCSTEPWFCEACRAGVTNPACELCPNSGNITVPDFVSLAVSFLDLCL